MIKPLTSLRFLFAIMVFSSHIPFLTPENAFFQEVKAKVFVEGYTGVGFFFILSGFILSLNYDQKLLSNRISFNEFWVARIARVIPVHITTLLLAVPLVWNYCYDNPALSFNKFLANAGLIHAFIPDLNYVFTFNAPAWSLSDEAFFYFAFPFIIFAFGYNSRLLKFGWILFLLIPLAIYFHPDEAQLHTLFYINPFYRIVDFILGMALHQLYATRKLAGLFSSRIMATLWEILALVALGATYVFHDAIPQGYRFSCYYWLPMAFTIFVFAYQKGYVSTLISTRTCVFLGEISFSFYMVHTLAIRYIETANTDFAWNLNQYLMASLMLGTALFSAYVLHKFIEVPLNLDIKRKFKAEFAKSRAGVL